MRWVLLIAVVAGVWFWMVSDGEAGKVECRGRAFPWSGECWSYSEGPEFAGDLREHGASPFVFKRKHPELAATFRQPWPPKLRSAWQTCQNGYACAKAVVQHFFPGQWSYALGIIGCETEHTYSKYVVGDAGEVSWWQIHPVHFAWVDEARAVADPRYATSVAIRIGNGSVREGGSFWGPWSCA
jgi:hypothetical protein